MMAEKSTVDGRAERMAIATTENAIPIRVQEKE
jgi:hypothetical protein